jgi:hypothetical protein
MFHSFCARHVQLEPNLVIALAFSKYDFTDVVCQVSFRHYYHDYLLSSTWRSLSARTAVTSEFLFTYY